MGEYAMSLGRVDAIRVWADRIRVWVEKLINKGVDERDKDASEEAYGILKHNKGVDRHDKAINWQPYYTSKNNKDICVKLYH